MNSDPASSRQRAVAILTSVLLVTSFAIVIVAAGHGAGPVGLLLVLGSFSAWGLHIALGWVGVISTLAALFCSRTGWQVGLATCGLACIAAAWLLFLAASEGRGFTLLSSIPVLVASVVRGFQLWRLSKSEQSAGAPKM